MTWLDLGEAATDVYIKIYMARGIVTARATADFHRQGHPVRFP